MTTEKQQSSELIVTLTDEAIVELVARGEEISQRILSSKEATDKEYILAIAFQTLQSWHNHTSELLAKCHLKIAKYEAPISGH